MLRVVVAIVLDYRNLFEILRSIGIVESYVWLLSAWVQECMRGGHGGVYTRALNWGIQLPLCLTDNAFRGYFHYGPWPKRGREMSKGREMAKSVPTNTFL